MAKETQNLVDLVQPQRCLALLQIAYKPHPHSSPIGKIMLGHSHSSTSKCNTNSYGESLSNSNTNT